MTGCNNKEFFIHLIILLKMHVRTGFLIFVMFYFGRLKLIPMKKGMDISLSLLVIFPENILWYWKVFLQMEIQEVKVLFLMLRNKKRFKKDIDFLLIFKSEKKNSFNSFALLTAAELYQNRLIFKWTAETIVQNFNSRISSLLPD